MEQLGKKAGYGDERERQGRDWNSAVRRRDMGNKTEHGNGSKGVRNQSVRRMTNTFEPNMNELGPIQFFFSI